MKPQSKCLSFLPLLSVVFTIAAFSPQVWAQGGIPLWTNRYDGPGNGSDIANAIAVDGVGNVFVTGVSSGAAGAGNDYATIKYSNAGAPVWTNRYNSAGNGQDTAQAMATDAIGNVIVAGHSSAGGSGYATIKYSGSGTPLWTNRYIGPGGSDIAAGIATDPGGNVFVTGRSSSGARTDFATLKYSGTGMSLWTNRYDDAPGADDFAWAIATDDNGNVVVAGGGFPAAYRTIKYSGNGVPAWTNRYSGGGNAFAVGLDRSGNVFVTGDACTTIKYSDDGAPLWTNHYDGPGTIRGLAVDAQGNVTVTGSSDGGSGSLDYLTIKYSAAGVPLWTNRYNGPTNLEDAARAIAVDSRGNVFVTGYSDRNGAVGAWGDWTTIAYSSAGLPLWTNRFSGPGNAYEEPNAIAVDASGNVFVAGYSSTGTYDYITIKYSSSIVPPPRLDYRRVNGELALMWPTNSSGFTLQSTTNLNPLIVWTDSTNTRATFGTNFIVTNAISAAAQFCRLSSQ